MMITLVIYVVVRKSELAFGHRINEGIVHLDERDEPVQYTQQLWPSVGTANRLQL
jgi:hypothetical protein